MVLDGAHSPGSAAALADTLRQARADTLSFCVLRCRYLLPRPNPYPPLPAAYPHSPTRLPKRCFRDLPSRWWWRWPATKTLPGSSGPWRRRGPRRWWRRRWRWPAGRRGARRQASAGSHAAAPRFAASAPVSPLACFAESALAPMFCCVLSSPLNSSCCRLPLSRLSARFSPLPSRTEALAQACREAAPSIPDVSAMPAAPPGKAGAAGAESLLAAAVGAARARVGSAGVVCVTGSLYAVAAARRDLRVVLAAAAAR